MSEKPTEFNQKTFIIGVGAQKSGTTWLYDYLDNRQDVYMHPLKEVHFFDGLYESKLWPNVVKNRLKKEKKMHAKLARFKRENNVQKLELYQQIKDRNRCYEEPDLYLQHFKNNVGQCKAFGEITAEYSTLSATTFRKMYQIHPDVRFVLLVRDPVDRLWSQIKMLSKFNRPGFEKDKSLAQRVDAALDKPMIIERSRYDKTIQNLLQHVPESRLFVGFFEELYCDESIARLCEFLTLPFAPGEYSKVINQSRGLELDQQQAIRIRQTLSQTYDFFSERYGTALPQKWRDYPS